MTAVLFIMLLGNVLGIPYGVQLNITTDTIPKSWSVVYEAPYSDHTKTSDFSRITDGCIFMGAKTNQHARTYVLGAFAETKVFLDPGKDNTKVAYLHNGVYWYNYNGKSVGFAPNSIITLNSADVKAPDSSGCELRLSWHLGQSFGGWRAGCKTGLNKNTVWWKVLLSGSCSFTDLPTAAPTESPTTAPTESSTTRPTELPTTSPTTGPTELPTTFPTTAPTESPTPRPTDSPTKDADTITILDTLTFLRKRATKTMSFLKEMRTSLESVKGRLEQLELAVEANGKMVATIKSRQEVMMTDSEDDKFD